MKKSTRDCKLKLRQKLLELGYDYSPEVDPVPTVSVSHLDGVTPILTIGCLTVVMKNKDKAAIVKKSIEEYHYEVKEARRLFKSRKSEPVTNSDDLSMLALQKELDSGMGVVGGAMGIVVGIFILAYVIFLKYHGM